MYDLFDVMNKDKTEEAKPLAERMRPVSLREFLGQSQILEDGSLLRRAISLDRVGSCIFWTSRDGKDDACEYRRKLDER